MSDMKKKLLEAFIKDGIMEDEAVQVSEVTEYIWEYNSLAEAIEDTCYQEYLDEAKFSSNRVYDIGDIIFTKQYYNPKNKEVVRYNGHRVLVITSKENIDGSMSYRGFVLSSKVDKSNKHSDYWNNLYIDDYSSILDNNSGSTIPCIVKVDTLVQVSSKHFSATSTYKGTVKDEFLQFVQKAYSNYKSGNAKENANMYWEVESK